MIEIDQSVVGEAEHFEARFVWAAFMDWQVNYQSMSFSVYLYRCS